MQIKEKPLKLFIHAKNKKKDKYSIFEEVDDKLNAFQLNNHEIKKILIFCFLTEIILQ